MNILTSMAGNAPADKISKNIASLMQNKESLYLYMDCFGNIVCPIEGKNLMLIPASSNIHLTKTTKLNALNSYIFNGMYKAPSGKNMISTIRQQDYSSSGVLFWSKTSTSGDSKLDYGNLPAAGSYDKNSLYRKGSVIMYYDTDTDVIRNDYTSVSLSSLYKSLVEKSIDKDISNMRFETVGGAETLSSIVNDDNIVELYNAYIYKHGRR